MHVSKNDPGDRSSAATTNNRRSATPGASSKYSNVKANPAGVPQPSQWDQLVASQVSDGSLLSLTDDDGYAADTTTARFSPGRERTPQHAGVGQSEGDEDWEWEDDTPFLTAMQAADTASVASGHGPAANGKSTMARRRRPQSSTVTKSRTIPRSPRNQQAFAMRSGRATPPIHQIVVHDTLAPPAPAFVEQAPNPPRQAPPPRTALIARHNLKLPWEDLARHLATYSKATISYTLSILKPAIRLMRFPLVAIAFLLIFAFTLNSVSGIFKSAFSPICYIPGVNMMGACRWINYVPPRTVKGVPGKRPHIEWADYQTLVHLESKTFDQLLDDSMGSLTGSLALNLKKTEIAVNDLVAVVKASDLASKERLAETLQEFVQDAKVAGRGLSRLSAKFNGALDSIMAVNDHALHTIGKARNSEPLGITGKLNGLMPWSPPRKGLKLVIKETFAATYDMLTSQVGRLVVEAEASHDNLVKLEESLSTLYSIVQLENATITVDREELLAQLWTKLGGHRKELRSFQRDLALLKELTAYRKQALAHVVGALHTLQDLTQEMEDIRERVAAPDLVGSRIAPEVHMKSIQFGLERLKESRLRARKMEEEAARKALGLDYNGDERFEAIESR